MLLFSIINEPRNRIRKHAKCGNLLTVFTPATKNSGGYSQEPRAKSQYLCTTDPARILIAQYEQNLGSDSGNWVISSYKKVNSAIASEGLARVSQGISPPPFLSNWILSYGCVFQQLVRLVAWLEVDPTIMGDIMCYLPQLLYPWSTYLGESTFTKSALRQLTLAYTKKT